MMSTMESSNSPVRSSNSAEKPYVTDNTCSPVKANVVETNLNDSCGGEALELPQLPSLTSSSRGFRASAAFLSKMSKSEDAVEKGEHALASLTPTQRHHQQSDAAVSLSSSLPARESQEMLSSTSLRVDGQHSISELPRTPHTTGSFGIFPSPLQQSMPLKWARTSVSLRSIMETPRSVEESVASTSLSETKPASKPPVARSSCGDSIALSEEADMCCICLEEYTNENPMFRGACQHHFHLPCLMEWKQRSTLCPMCCAETLRGVGEFEALHQCVAADPAEVARQQDIAKRDAEIAQNLQHKYLRQAQRRDSYDARIAHAVHSGSPRGSTSRTVPPAAEVSLRLSTTFQTENRGNSQRPGNIARVPSLRRPKRPEGVHQQRVTANGHSRATQPPVHTGIQGGQRSHRRLQPGCVVM
ncbi:hypothetical protein JIQ42_04083 [Leishmania sp. Namibia]|uniref:hypothetical protein n=1 Tax=Leishmania sp. Namibia TaxID=2802991 RepID=UPI001B5ADA3A|nr:hypothetical protein JIQ42_04083 [Leishmania sp. Namibia]